MSLLKIFGKIMKIPRLTIPGTSPIFCPDIETIIKTGKLIWQTLKEVFSIGEMKKYDFKEATVDETMKVNELLEKCIQQYKPEAQKYDTLAEETIDEYFKNIKLNLENINNESIIINFYMFDMFEFKTKEIKKDLDKIYSREIEKTFSLNNNDILSILKLDAGEVKKDRIKEFAKKTLEKANIKLMNQLEEYLLQLQEYISSELNKFLENKENEYQTSLNESKIIEDTIKKGEKEIEFKRRKYEYLLYKLSNLKIN